MSSLRVEAPQRAWTTWADPSVSYSEGNSPVSNRFSGWAARPAPTKIRESPLPGGRSPGWQVTRAS